MAFEAFPLPTDFRYANHSSEPSIGIPWNTNHVFFQALSGTYRAAFSTVGDKQKVQWTDVTPPFAANLNLDPVLTADPASGRVAAGGLLGPCSLMGVSDDDGAAWQPSRNMCTGPHVDHPSLGFGPWAPAQPSRSSLHPRAAYYCAQFQRAACATSIDGGLTWLPFVELLGGCSGFHGHIHVSNKTGMAAVPHTGCTPTAGEGGGQIGFAYTTDNGLSWPTRTVPGSRFTDGFDPALAFSQTSGWLYLAQAAQDGLHVSMSKDEGLTWETLGGKTAGVTPDKWLNLSAAYSDPITHSPIKYAAFVDVLAGDDNRAAISFLGTTDPAGVEPFSCVKESDPNIWQYYLAQTFDAGATWAITRIQEDPVQIGGIWSLGGLAPCRNLEDFNDMQMDSQGRIFIGFADGCIHECSAKYFAYRNAQGPKPTGADSRDSYGTLLRQSSGPTLFAKFDSPVSNGPDASIPLPASHRSGLDAGLVATVGLLAATVVRRKAF